MKNSTLLSSAFLNKDYSYLIKLCFSLVSAHLIIVCGIKRPYISVFNSDYYLKVLIINGMMTYLLATIVQKVTGLVQTYPPWIKSVKHRVAAQVSWGIFLPMSPAVGITVVYSAYYGSELVDFASFLLQVLIMLTVLNLHFYWKRFKKSKRKNSTLFGGKREV